MSFLAEASVSARGESSGRSFVTAPHATVQEHSQAHLQARVNSTFYFRPAEVPPKFIAGNAQWNAQDRQVQFWVRNTGTISANPRTRWNLTRDGVAISSGNIEATTVIEGTRRRFDLAESGDRLTLQPGQYELVGELNWRFEAEDYSQLFTLSFSVR